MSTSQAHTQSSCAVCGQGMQNKAGVTDAKGRPVCVDCIEAARQLVARRESRKRQVEAIKKSEAELSRVEDDNSAVLHMTEDEVLALARFACANCGRVLPVAGAGCEACGFGTSLGVPSKRRSRLRFGLRGPAAHASSLFPQFDPRIVTGSGTAVLLLGALAPLSAVMVRWMWEGATVITVGLAVAGIALLAFSRRNAIASTIPFALGAIVAMVLLVRGLSGPTSQSLVVWLSVGVVALALQLWTLLTASDDWLVKRVMAASLIAQTGMIVLAIIRCSQVA